MIINVNLQDKTVRNIYDVFKKYSIEFNVENIRLFFSAILNMQIEDINFNLNCDMQLELIPSTLTMEDINSSLFYDLLQEIQLDYIIEDVNISANMDMEITLSLNYVLEDINFNCVTTLVVIKTYGDIKGLVFSDIKNEVYDNLCWTELTELVVIRTYGDIKGLVFSDIKNEVYDNLCWTER